MMRRCMPAAAFAVLSLLVIAGDVRAEDPPAGDVTAFEKGSRDTTPKARFELWREKQKC